MRPSSEGGSAILVPKKPENHFEIRKRNISVLIRIGYQHARSNRTALETFSEGVGVCRDFTHLAITLCRCLNIPARYVTGYLGDIGVLPMDAPKDFSAWMEAYLGGRWYSFDARHNQPRIGRIVIARGRDAADVPITMVFANHRLEKFSVVTEEINMNGKSQTEVERAVHPSPSPRSEMKSLQ